MEEAICHVNDYHDGNKYKEGLTRMKCKRTPRRPPTRDAKINSYQKNIYIINILLCYSQNTKYGTVLVAARKIGEKIYIKKRT
jgi:hypothetical protein